MKAKKILSMLLLIAMVLTLLPAIAVADSGTVVQDGITLTKSATLEDDGSYTINLDAYATGTETTVKVSVPLDIVLVLDLSSSMGIKDSGSTNQRITDLKTAVRAFANNIAKNANDNDVDHRIAVTTFAANDSTSKSSSSYSGAGTIGTQTQYANTGIFTDGDFVNYRTVTSETTSGHGKDEKTTYTYADLTTTQYYNSLVLADDGTGTGNLNSTLDGYITKLLADSYTGTHTLLGVTMANGVFAAHKNDEDYADRKRIVVLFTDGNTNDTQSTVIEQAKLLKSNYDATVYCVQLGTDSIGTFLSQISSNFDKDGNQTYDADGNKVTKYSMQTDSSEELTKIFEDISKDASESATKLTAEAVMKDVVANGLSVIEVGSDLSKATAVTTTVYNATTTDGTTVTKGDPDSSVSASASIDYANNTVNITGFDYAQYYVTKDHPGKMICVTITGILPDADTAVFGEATSTNGAASGIYENSTAADPAATFYQPKTILTQHAYVIDYAKQTVLDGLDQNVSITGIYSDFQNATANTSVTGTYGDTTLSGTTVTYTPKTMQWDGYDNIYVFGKTNDSDITSVDANANGNVWSKLSVIPANNVYYEDSFTTGSSTVGIEFSGNWTTTGAESGNVEHANGTGYAAEQGWEESLADDATYSDGSAHVSSTKGATATFTFTGTGVDIYSYTDAKSGIVVGRLSGDKLTSDIKNVLVVDNEAVSGEYYQIPTLSWMGLEYGTYTVTIYVQADTDGNSTYYLDGVRVYSPLSEEAEDAVVAEAYTDELGATFAEVRDVLVDSGSFGKDGETAGAVFIDYNGDDGVKGEPTSVVGTYEDYGPKNEVYLANGQAIIFAVSSDNISIGLKAPDGSATTATVTNASGTTDLSIASAADLYYEIVPDDDGYVEIKNNGNGLLAVTKIKDKDAGTTTTLMSMDYATVDYKAAIFDSLDSTNYYGTVVAEHVYEAGKTEETEQQTEEQTTEEQPVEEQPAVEVVISNPQPAATKDAALAFVRTLFAGIRNILGRR